MNSGIKISIRECGPPQYKRHAPEKESSMFYFKACTKCHGDLTLERDSYGDFLKCMQCGTLTDVEIDTGDRGQKSLLNQAGAQAPRRILAKTVVAA